MVLLVLIILTLDSKDIMGYLEIWLTGCTVMMSFTMAMATKPLWLSRGMISSLQPLVMMLSMVAKVVIPCSTRAIGKIFWFKNKAITMR